MMVHRLFLCVLALPFDFAIGSSNPLQTLGMYDNERCLQQGNSEVVCDNPEDLFYNIFFTLNDPIGNATANCIEDDYIVMGLLIQDIVEQIDEDFPKYANEFVDTSVCAVPAWSFGESNQNRGGRTLLEKVEEWAHRRLGTYTYVAGGRCRRCTTSGRALFEEVDDYVHRRLQTYPRRLKDAPTRAPTGSPTRSIPASEAADAACDMASTTKFALSVCEKGDGSCRGVVNDIVSLLREQKWNSKEAKKVEQAAKKKCDLITKSLKDVRLASIDADLACTEAEKKASLLQQDTAVEEMVKADAALKIAAETAEEAQRLYAEAREVKHDIMKEIMVKDFKVRDQKLKKLVEEEEKEYLQLKSEIAKLEKNIAHEETKQEQENTRLKVKALNEKLVFQQRKHDELSRTIAAWTEDVTDEHEFAKMMDEYKYGLTTAIDVDHWLEQYRMLLQHAVPKFLYDWYNTTGAGCLDPLFDDDFTATVELVEVAGRNETLSEKCESPDFSSGP